jgi:iron(III) transport system substrate-binding protein
MVFSLWFIFVAISFSVFLVISTVHADKELTFYGNWDIDELKVLVPMIENDIGVKLKYHRMSSTELWSRVQAEAPHFNADMIWGFMNAHALIGTQRGWFIPYKSKAWKDIPANFQDPDGHWYGSNYWFAAGVMNTKLLKEKNLPAPKSWQDFGKPIYKGELVMPNPGTSGTAFLSVSALMQIFGEEKGWELLAKLNENAGQLTKSGTAPAQLVAQGEYAVGISWDQAIYGRVAKGFPIEGLIPSEGTAYDLDSSAILKGCKNLDAAKKLTDWLGTVKGQTAIGELRSKTTRPGSRGK